MPSIDEILASIQSGKSLDDIDADERQKVAEQERADTEKANQESIPEHEKLALELERLLTDDEEKDTELESIATPPEEEQMKKMAVAATVMDTLQDLDLRGESKRSFSEHFQEK